MAISTSGCHMRRFRPGGGKKFHRDFFGTVEDLNHVEMISDVDDPNRANWYISWYGWNTKLHIVHIYIYIHQISHALSGVESSQLVYHFVHQRVWISNDTKFNDIICSETSSFVIMMPSENFNIHGRLLLPPLTVCFPTPETNQRPQLGRITIGFPQRDT